MNTILEPPTKWNNCFFSSDVSIVVKRLPFIVLLVSFLLFFLNPDLKAQGLIISKTGPFAANPGDIIRYTITYQNVSADFATGVEITDILPSYLYGSLISSNPAGTISGNTIIWTSAQIPNLAKLDNNRYTIDVQFRVGLPDASFSPDGFYIPTSPITLENYAQIKSNEITTPVESNKVETNVSQFCGTNNIPALDAEIKSSKDSYILRLIAITNTGNIYDQFTIDLTEGVSTVVLLKQILDYNRVSISGLPDPDLATATTAWLAPGETAFFYIKLIVDQSPAWEENNTVTTIRSVVCNSVQSITTNTTVHNPIDPFLFILKTGSPATVIPGDTLYYSLMVYNNRDGEIAQDAVLTETYPPGTTFLSANPMPDIGDTTWTLGDIAESGIKEVSIAVTVDANSLCADNTLVNTASVDYSNNSIDPIETTASTLLESTPLAVSNITSTNITCNGLKDGTITVEATGTDPLLYTLFYRATLLDSYTEPDAASYISDGNGNFSALEAGFYKVRITEPNCPPSFLPPVESVEVYIAEPAVLTATGLELSAVNCFGGNDGSATITPSGGTGPYTITPAPTGLTAGTTTFTVTDANLCTTTADADITEPLTALSASISSQTNVICKGDTTGEIDLTIMGGTSPYTFDWTTSDGSGLINTDEDQTGLTEGTYDVQVTDANNCTALAQAILTIDDMEKPVIHNVPADVILECSDCIQSFENNDFEEPVISGSWAAILASDISGWATTASSNIIEIQKSGGVDGVLSYSGNQHAELNGDEVGDLYQEFCTVPTTTVQISFAHHKRMAFINTSDDIMQVLSGPDLAHLDTLGQFTATNSSGWTVHTVNFPIPIGQTSTVFVFRALQGAPSNPTYGNLIDDINVVTLFDATNIPYATDNCAVESLTLDEVKTDGACLNDYKIVRTWTATDLAGNKTTATQLVSVGDDKGPEFTLPSDTTISCTENPNDTTITGNISMISDNCDAAPITFTYSDVISPGTCPANYTITRTWIALDHCSNTTSKSQIITVKDSTPPTADSPAPISVQCSGDVPASDISIILNVADNCTTNPTVAWVSDVSDGLSCPETITRTYSISDDCGNSSNITQIITINDTIKPTASDPAPLFTDCNANIPSADISVVTDEADNCTPNPIVAWVSDVSDNLSCPETITRTYSVTDDCSNQILVKQTIVVHDTIDPVITCPANISVSNDVGVCGSMVTYSVNSSDNCSGLTLTRTGGLPSGSLFPTGTTTNTFIVEDPCGNSATCNFDVVVTDNEAPTVITQNVTVFLDASGNGSITAALVDNGSNDACGIDSLALDKTDFTCADIASNPNSVMLTVTDNNGNTSSATALVTVVDTVSPVAMTQNVTVILDASGNGSTTAALVNNGSHDACGIASLALDKTDFTCADIPVIPNTVTLTVKDNNGNTSSATALVKVIDNMLPVAIAQDVTVYLDATGNGSTTADLVNNGSNDACGIASLALDKTDFTCADIASNPNTVTLTVTDINGNTSTTSAQVTVIDTIPPVAIAQNVNVFLDAAGNGSTTASLVDNGSNDACGIASITLDKTDFTCADIAANPNTVALTVTDNNGITSTAMAQVTVVDTIPPVAIAQNVTVFLDATGNGSTAAALVNNGSNDACGIASLALDKTNFTCADIAAIPNTVTLTVKDNNGNTSSTTALVTVIDNILPIAIAQDVTVYLDASGNGATTAALVNNGSNDACGIASLALDKTAFTCADITTNPNTVTLTVTDNNGNTSTATAQVTVVDTVPPVAIAQNLTVNLAPTGHALITAFAVNNGSNDACGIASLAIDKTAFTCADIANNPNTITLTVKDNNGNTSSTTAQVTVIDTIPPVAIAQNVTVVLDAAGNGSTSPELVDNGSTDACGVASLTLDKTDFTCADIASNPNSVTLTVTDNNGNTSSATAQVMVVDNIPPVAIAQNLTVNLDATGHALIAAFAVDNGSNDACGIASLALDKTAFSCADIATNPNTVTLTVKDNNGNTSSTTAQITIVDNVPPVAIAQNVTVILDDTGNGTTTADLVDNGSNDACGITSLALDKTAFSCADIAANPNTVTLTVKDNNGNTSSATAQVTVIDNILPVAIAQNVTVVLDATGNGSTTAALVDNGSNDACGIASLTLDKTDFTCADIAANPNTVTLTVTDNNGNTSSTTAQVTVVDNILPVAIAQNVNVFLDATGNGSTTAALVDNGSNDACGIASITLDKTDFTCADIAANPNTVALTVTDNNGITSTAMAQVTVVDTVPPVAIAQNVTVFLDATGNGSTTAALVNNGSNDACGIASLTLDKTDFTCADIAANPNTVTLTVKDNNGNTSTASAQVTVIDNLPPVAIAQNVTVVLDATGKGSTSAALVDNGSNDACGIASLALDKTDFTCADIASNPNTVTLTVTDNNGNTSTAMAQVTVIDNLSPVAIAQNVTVILDATGKGSTSADLVDNGSNDACGIASLTLDKTDFNCADIASNPNTVTLTVTDNNGNTSTATAQVTVVDNISPFALAHNVTLFLDATGNGSITASFVDNGSSDACGIASLVLDKTDFSCADIAGNPNTVTLTVTDNNGNTSTVNAKVTVIDNIAPIVSEPIDTFIEACSSADIGDPTVGISDLAFSTSYVTINLTQLNKEGISATDNCHIASITYSDRTDGGSCPEIMTRTFTITDDSGNSTAVDYTITIHDTSPPTASNPADMLVQCRDEAVIDIEVVTDEADNCTSFPLVEFYSDESDHGSCPETITRTYQITDNCGNSIFVKQKIIVEDTIKPTASNPHPIFVERIGDIPAPDTSVVFGISDNCSEKPLVQFTDDTPDGFDFLRTIYRRYSVTDNCGNRIYVTQNININGFPYPKDDHYTIDENSKDNVFKVLENDDFGGDGPGKYGNEELKIEIVSEPQQGLAIVTKNPANPDEQYIEYTPPPNYYQKDSFEYSIIDKSGDEATAMVFIDFIPNPLFIPEAFSPNGDGFNDTFHILGLYYYPNNSIVIFDQSGSTVFQAAPYLNDWDGKDMYNRNLLPQNTYYFLFDLGNGSRKIKGFVYIMRK